MRLIDADALNEKLWQARVQYQMLDDTQTADKIMRGIHRAEQILADSPIIDAVPVKHGEWVKTGQSFVNPNCFRNYCCSVCGYDIEKTKFNYCPNCGAKMDGERCGADE